jgi:hypothetical protein
MPAPLTELHMPVFYSSMGTSNKYRTEDSFHKEMFFDIMFQTNIALITPHNFPECFAIYELTTLIYVRPIMSQQNFANHHLVTAQSAVGIQHSGLQ